MASLVAGNRTRFRATLTDQDGTAIDLSDKTVHLRYTIDGGDTVEVEATVSDAASGICYYEMTEDELSAGIMIREWKLTDASSKVYTGGDRFTSLVRSALPAAS